MKRPTTELEALFYFAFQNPQAGINRPGRGLGKHAAARFERSRAKASRRRGKKYISKLFPSTTRPAAGYSQFSPKVNGVRYRCDKGQMVPRT